LIITIEDNVISGGFGSAVLETLSKERINTNVYRVGWPDQFVPHASDNKTLQKQFGIDLESILKVIDEFTDSNFKCSDLDKINQSISI